MTTGTDYKTAAVQLLEQARAELELGDIRRASEKGWGAAAQAVKAVAEGRGLEHDTHGSLFRAVRLLGAEPGNDELTGLFGNVNTLHVNFYENWLTSMDVERRLADVARFVALMSEME